MHTNIVFIILALMEAVKKNSEFLTKVVITTYYHSEEVKRFVRWAGRPGTNAFLCVWILSRVYLKTQIGGTVINGFRAACVCSITRHVLSYGDFPEEDRFQEVTNGSNVPDSNSSSDSQIYVHWTNFIKGSTFPNLPAYDKEGIWKSVLHNVSNKWCDNCNIRGIYDHMKQVLLSKREKQDKNT
jgi:hypothetical protein